MARHFDHAGMEILTREKCLRILHDQTLGRMGFVTDDHEPVILPVAYRFWRGRIYFLSSGGSKLQAASGGRRVAFEIDGWNAAERTGWSVLARGICTPVDEADLAEVAECGLSPWLRTALRPMHWVQILPDEITGRRLPDSQIPPEWD